MTGDKESAIKSHLAIVALLLETQDTRDRVLAEWAEEGLYKAIQLVTHERLVETSLVSAMTVTNLFYTAATLTWQTS